MNRLILVERDFENSGNNFVFINPDRLLPGCFLENYQEDECADSADDDKINIYVIAPNGIGDKYLQVYVMHPKGLSGDPGLSLVEALGYGVDGGPLATAPQFSYYPQ